MSKTEDLYVRAIISEAAPHYQWIWALRCAIDMERKRCANIAADSKIKRKDVAKRIKEGKYPGDPE